MESIKLNRKNLGKIKIKTPYYQEIKSNPSIVHIGLGNFHRAHKAAYLDELLDRKLYNNGIFAINLVPDIFPIKEILKEQDNLYTLVIKESGDNPPTARIVGTISGYINTYNDPAAMETALKTASGADTKIISLTVTEGGYYFNKKTMSCDTEKKEIKQDLKNPDNPITAAAFIANVLARRYCTNKMPLTIMSCDNVHQNGKILESCVKFFCRENYREILSWAEDNVSFPSSMVDRITVATTESLIDEVKNRYGITDLWPVSCEDFKQWVLEYNFKTQIPEYHECGIQLVKNVEPYEKMKMRLLNGSHLAIAYTGYLSGFKFADEAITNPVLQKFTRRFFMEEVTPTLEPVPGIDLELYKDRLITRFANKNIGDTLTRLTSQGSAKIPDFILNTLLDKIKKSESGDSLIFVLSSWARYLSGTDEKGNIINIEDTNKALICSAAEQALVNPKKFLTAAGLTGLSESQLNTIAQKFSFQLDKIYKKGIMASLQDFTE